MVPCISPDSYLGIRNVSSNYHPSRASRSKIRRGLIGRLGTDAHTFMFNIFYRTDAYTFFSICFDMNDGCSRVAEDSLDILEPKCMILLSVYFNIDDGSA